MEITPWRAWVRLALASARSRRTPRGARRWMERCMAEPSTPPPAAANGAAPPKPPARVVTLYLVRHGQTRYNVEHRLPGQLPGIPLNDEGVRQVERLGETMREIPLSGAVTSPLERAYQTATIVLRGHDVLLRTDPRLMDTNVGRWAGQTIGDVAKSDPEWRRFVHRPTQPPPGIEGFYQVLARAVAAAEDARHDETLGRHIVLVAHADVIKLLIAHYLRLPIEGAGWLTIDNASVTALAFADEHDPVMHALNWTPSPAWLRPAPPAEPATVGDAVTQASEAADAGKAGQDGTEAPAAVSGEESQP
jgi:broad specificity phosphatase PhoE